MLRCSRRCRNFLCPAIGMSEYRYYEARVQELVDDEGRLLTTKVLSRLLPRALRITQRKLLITTTKSFREDPKTKRQPASRIASRPFKTIGDRRLPSRPSQTPA